MDNNLLYEISYTLNEIRDSLTSTGWFKQLIPVLSALGGGLFVFLMNLLKEICGSKAKISKYKSCILMEMEVIMYEAVENIKFLFNEKSKAIESKTDVLLRSYSPMVFVCFDKFFHEIASDLTAGEFKRITGIYSAARLADNSGAVLSSHSARINEKTVSPESVEELMSEFMNLYILCDKHINNANYTYQPNALDIAIKLNISGSFVDSLKGRY